MALTDKLSAIADAIRSKTGGNEALTLDQMPIEISKISAGATPSAEWNDVTFIDYDGAVLYSYSLEEAKALTELPALPSHDGLVCQGWNYDLETIKSYDRPVTIGAMYITDDGKTRIYIHLEQGRTSPMLGVCPKGTVTVDWGDGTEPDVLTGEDVTVPQWTPNHDYANPGDYVISLSVDGEMGFYYVSYSDQGSGIIRCASGEDDRNMAYQNSVRKLEIGAGVLAINEGTFNNFYSLTNVSIPDSVASIDSYAFSNCYSLASVSIPKSVTYIGDNAFPGCYSLASVSIPEGVASIGYNAFTSCYTLTSVYIPESVVSIGGYAFNNCLALKSVVIPMGVDLNSSAFMRCYSLQKVVLFDGVNIGSHAFDYCYALTSVVIPKDASIGGSAFQNCSTLTSVVISEGVTFISDSAFRWGGSVRYYDFTACTSVPTLENTNAFSGNTIVDCEMLIPAALYDEWSTATNWAAYASYMVAV